MHSHIHYTQRTSLQYVFLMCITRWHFWWYCFPTVTTYIGFICSGDFLMIANDWATQFTFLTRSFFCRMLTFLSTFLWFIAFFFSGGFLGMTVALLEHNLQVGILSLSLMEFCCCFLISHRFIRLTKSPVHICCFTITPLWNTHLILGCPLWSKTINRKGKCH